MATLYDCFDGEGSRDGSSISSGLVEICIIGFEVFLIINYESYKWEDE